MSDAEREKWDARYAGAEPPLARAPEWLQPMLVGEVPGRALEVGCGAGALALWLAARGYQVTALDISETALALTRTAAEREGLALQCEVRDLERDALPLGPFSLITCLHFKPPGGLAPLCGRLAPGGRLCLETATLENLSRHAHPSRRYLVEPGEWSAQVRDAGCEVELDEADWFEGRHLCRMIARRG